MKQCTQKRLFLLSVLLLLTIYQYSTASTITSTTTGGLWSSTSTWIGSTVPASTDNVILNGNVVVNGFVYCNDLTVDSAVILQNQNTAVGYVYISGNLINKGTIRNNPTNYSLNLYVSGNVQNDGSLTNSILDFYGYGTQQMGGSKPYGSGNIIKENNGSVLATADIVFLDSLVRFDLFGDTLNMGSYKLTMKATSTKFINGGIVCSSGELDISGYFRSDLAGNPTLVGNMPMMFDECTVYGNLTIANGKIIENYDNSDNGYNDLYVLGNLINYGTIRNRRDIALLQVFAYSNVYNYGSMTNSWIEFEADTAQTLTSTTPIGCGYLSKYPDGIIKAGSDLVFSDSSVQIDLAYDTLYMGNYKLTMKSGFTYYYIQDGTVYSDGEVDISGVFVSSFAGNPTLVGDLPMQFYDCNVYGNLNVKAGKVIENYSQSYDDLTIYGDLSNNGTITDQTHLYVYTEGNIKNSGIWTNTLVTLLGTKPQSIGLVFDRTIASRVEMISDIDGDNYQWFKDNNPIDNAVYSTFGLDSVSTLQYGQYKCAAIINGDTIWSRIITIQRGIIDLNAPELISPINYAGNLTLPITFDWTDVPYSNSYKIQLSSDYNFSNIIYSQDNISSSTFSIPLVVYKPNTTYYWRVAAIYSNLDTLLISPWSGRWSFTIASATSQVIELKSGVNFVSTYLLPSDSSIAKIVANLTDAKRLILMKDFVGNIFFPLLDIDNLSSWDPLSAYFIIVTKPVILTISGAQIEPQNQPIHLHLGWNYVPYLRSTPMAASTALAGISSKLLIAKNAAGEIYTNNQNTFEQGTSNAGKMLPGKGYFIYVTAQVTLTYPSN